MLVLSRFRDEVIKIGDDVQVKVVDIRGDKVRLGITAPRHIQIDRLECIEAQASPVSNGGEAVLIDPPQLGQS